MKKFIFAFALLCAMSACTSFGTSKAGNDVDTTAVDSVDTVSVDSVAL